MDVQIKVALIGAAAVVVAAIVTVLVKKLLGSFKKTRADAAVEISAGGSVNSGGRISIQGNGNTSVHTQQTGAGAVFHNGTGDINLSVQANSDRLAKLQKAADYLFRLLEALPSDEKRGPLALEAERWWTQNGLYLGSRVAGEFEHCTAIAQNILDEFPKRSPQEQLARQASITRAREMLSATHQLIKAEADNLIASR